MRATDRAAAKQSNHDAFRLRAYLIGDWAAILNDLRPPVLAHVTRKSRGTPIHACTQRSYWDLVPL
jgi:hypothetical protein